MTGLALALLVGLADARDPCETTRVSTTRSDGRTTLRIGSGTRTLTLSDGAVAAKLRLSVAGLHDDVLSPGVPLLWTLSDGTQVTLVSSAPAKPIPSRAVSSASDLQTAWVLELPLSVEAVHAFATAPAIGLQAELAGSPVPFDDAALDTQRLQRDFACLANLLPRESEDAP